MDTLMLFFQLFGTFFLIGAFTIGGGYAMLSLIQGEVVTAHQWISESTFTDIVAISQMTPGPISINMATYVGYTMGGFGGSLLASFAICLPSLVMVYLVMRLMTSKKSGAFMANLLKGLKPAVAGLIFAAGLSMMNAQNFVQIGKGENNISIVICVLAFTASYFFKANPILLILLSGAVGFLVY